MKREYRDPRPGEIQRYLSTHANWVKRYDRGEIRFRPSPCCRSDNPQNPSCQINEATGLWRCFSGSCGAVGNWFTLTRAFCDPLPEDDRFRDPGYVYSPQWVQRFEKQVRRPVTNGHYPDLLDYCLGRGIDRDTLDLWRVSTKGEHNLRWPIYFWHQNQWELVNIRVRSCIGNKPGRDWFDISGGPTDLLLGNHLIKIKGPERAIITEGQWDCMTLTQIGMTNVFSLPCGASNVRVAEMLRYIPEHWEIWLGMDADAAGDKAVEKFFHQLGPEKVARIKFPCKDANAWLQEKPDLTEQNIKDCLVGLTKQTMVTKTADYMILDMADDGKDEQDIIVDTPFPVLNDYLAGGFRCAQTTGVLAPSGRGKTTLVNQLGIYAANQGVNVGLISVEGGRRALKRKLQEAIRGTCQERTWDKTMQHLHISPLEGSRVNWRDCVASFQAMAEAGARLLILDNLDFITRDSNAEKSQAYAEIIEICRQANCHGLVVWQPNKVSKDAVVNSGNQKGYSQTFQDSDNYLSLNRIRDYNVIDVEKCREEGVDGDGKVWIVYEKKSRAFKPCSEAPATNMGLSLSVLPMKNQLRS